VNEAEGGGAHLPGASLVDAMSISNYIAKHRSEVSFFCRVQNVLSACNAGGSSSLHARMNAEACLMQPLRGTATDLKTGQRFLHQESNTQRKQELALQKE
jgi:hypothetical protein